MLQRVKINGLREDILPRLYLAENSEDVKLAKTNGIPFIRWNQGMEALVKQLLRPTLERLFPDIKWSLVLGRRKRFKTKVSVCDERLEVDDDKRPEVHDISVTSSESDNDGSVKQIDVDTDEDEDGIMSETADVTTYLREFHTVEGESDEVTYKTMDIEDYVGDLTASVNVEVLQKLRLMPAFIGDIVDCVRTNIGNGLYWQEGYNKKRNLLIGRYDASRQKKNLIILDVSGSIPRGISATMLTLIDTLRTQVSADLIITSTKSKFYPMGCELPKPQDLRSEFGYGNETYQFFEILSQKIKGQAYGHVFSFGDNDSPYWSGADTPSLVGTSVEHVHHYHTGAWIRDDDFKTGYAIWCHHLARQPMTSYDKDWCRVIRN